MEVKQMKIIGLTGGSGTGKGTVAARMRSLGAGWVDADAVYRTLCAESREMLDALDTAFGGVTDENGALDRPKLAKIVFSDPERLALLNRAASLAAIRAQSACPVVLYDAPTLFEAGADDFCDAVIAVLAPHDTRVSRIIERDHLPEEAARARIDAQPPDSFYRAKCGYIIENNGDLDTLYRDTDALYQILMK